MQITLNGKAKYVGDYKRLTYENICVLLGEFNPGNGNVVTITHFNRKTKRSGSLSPGESVTVNKNLVINAVRTSKA